VFPPRTYEIRRADGTLVWEGPSPLSSIEGLDGLVLYDVEGMPELRDGDTITVRLTKSVRAEAEQNVA
jgi:hypothetical protein